MLDSPILLAVLRRIENRLDTLEVTLKEMDDRLTTLAVDGLSVNLVVGSEHSASDTEVDE